MVLPTNIWLYANIHALCHQIVMSPKRCWNNFYVIHWFFIGSFGVGELTFRQNWFWNDGLRVDYLLKWQWRKWNVNLSNRTEFRLTGWYSVFINWVFLWKLNTHQRLIFELEQVILKIYRLEHFSDSKNHMFSYMYILKIMKKLFILPSYNRIR